MANFKSVCPSCNSEFEVAEHQIGRVYSCKNCRQECIIPSQRIDPGMIFGNYEIQYPLGAGASGEVHLGKDVNGNKAAIKILFPNEMEEMDIKRFLREARFTRSLDHDGIIRLYDTGQLNDLNYIIMEYVEGETLDVHLEKFGELSEYDALKITRDVADVMAYVWREQKLVHRDIKPSNLMVSYDGVTKLMDLGIAKSMMYEMTQLTDPETIIGSPPYMSPEQCAPGKVLDFRADIYSLGCSLYQFVTNEYAFFADSPMSTVRMQILEKFRDPREFIPGLSYECTALIYKMMAKSIKDRHHSWEELIVDIDKIIT